MFRFAHRELLFLLAFIPLLVIFYRVAVVGKKRDMAKFGNPDLLASLMPLASIRRESWKFVLSVTAVVLAIIAAAGPQFGSKLQNVKKEGVELMIALDVSNSMLAEDIKPNRLDKAKMAIFRMLEKLKDDKVGIIVFAGDAYVQLPITTDYSSAKLFLSSVNPDILPVQGTSIGAAIDLGVKSFSSEQKEIARALIVITDGENHEDDAEGAARAARKKGIYVHTIGMGLPQGAPIPEPTSGGYMKDEGGNVVVSKLDEKMLADIAEAGEGLYVRATNADIGLNTLLEEIGKMNKSLLEERVYSDYEEKYRCFLIPALFFIFIEFMVLARKNRRLMKLNLFKKIQEEDYV